MFFRNIIKLGEKYDNQREIFKKICEAKDTDFIKVITGVRRSGKSTLLLMFKDCLLNNGIKESNIIHINFESAMYDDIKIIKIYIIILKIK